MENRKIVLSSYVIASFVLWFVARSGLYWLHQTFYQVRKVPGMLVIREALPLVIAILAFGILFKNAQATAFMDDVVSELKKVTWPARPDVIRSTFVVLFCVAIAAGFIALADMGWGKLVGLLLHL